MMVGTLSLSTRSTRYAPLFFGALRMRTLVTFKSTAFNSSEPRDYFINPCCFGDDVARWLINELPKRGFETSEEPQQEDFGWYFGFRIRGLSHTFFIGFRSANSTEDGEWIGLIQRTRGLIGSMLGREKVGVQPDAAHAIHSILSESKVIDEVRWHLQSEFDRGQEEAGASAPET
jgi:hypothetical protein